MSSPPREMTEAEAAELSKIGFEPDNVPAKLLVNVTLALTISVVLSVLFAKWFFDNSVSSELQAKGYTTEMSAQYEEANP